MKFSKFDHAYQAIAAIMQNLYQQHAVSLKSDKLNQYDQAVYQRILNLEASPIDLGNSLKNLNKHLHR